MVEQTNCKLTNTLIDLTRQLSEKQLEYERLMIRYFAEKKEKWFLQQKVERRDRTIENLNRELKDLRETRFCDDLIEMNDVESKNEKGKLCVCVYIMTFLNTNKSHFKSTRRISGSAWNFHETSTFRSRPFAFRSRRCY